LRLLLAHRAPQLTKGGEAMAFVGDGELELALEGLEARMPSGAKQVFDACLTYVGGACADPHLWESAIAVAAAMLREASTAPQLSATAAELTPLLQRLRQAPGRRPPGAGRAISDLNRSLQACGKARAGGTSAELQALKATLEEVCRDLGDVPVHAPPPPLPDTLEEGVSVGGKSCTPRRQAPSLARESMDVCGVGIRGGEPLSASNLKAFAEAVAVSALEEQLQPFLGAVVAEFRRVVPAKLLRGLSWRDLQDRLSGQRLDQASFVAEWRRHTICELCDDDDPAIELWWRHVRGRSPEELRRLFAWCTGYAAAPVTAWKFQIQVIEDTSRCPTVNTCLTDDPSAANRGVKRPTLYLPAYSSAEELARRFDWAIAGACEMMLR